MAEQLLSRSVPSLPPSLAPPPPPEPAAAYITCCFQMWGHPMACGSRLPSSWESPKVFSWIWGLATAVPLLHVSSLRGPLPLPCGGCSVSRVAAISGPCTADPLLGQLFGACWLPTAAPAECWRGKGRRHSWAGSGRFQLLLSPGAQLSNISNKSTS